MLSIVASVMKLSYLSSVVWASLRNVQVTQLGWLLK